MPDNATSDHPAVQAQLDRLNALSPGKDVLGLERITALLDRLGNPHLTLPPLFHVAGTNGKGSTCAFLRAMIEAAGLSAHVYTSPHLVRFNERTRIAGRLVEDDALAALLAEVLSVADGIGASFFEVTTAAALLAFSRAPADACILEVGLGGRLDATNVIASPAVCGIASLGIDHEAFLLAEEAGVPTEPMVRIGYEKAGIAKPGAPLVIQRYPEAITAAIAEQARRAGAVLLTRGSDWDAEVRQDRLRYRDSKGTLDLPLPTLAGAHQADNAALAVAMLRHQSAIAVDAEAMAEGIRSARWPARLQKLGDGPLTALLPQDTSLWLDGGHNPDAGAHLAAFFRERTRRLHLVIGMLANKDPAAIAAPLHPMLASVTVVPVPGHECHPPERFSTSASPLAVRIAPDVQAALTALNPGQHEDVLIAGSLYLAGEILRANGEALD